MTILKKKVNNVLGFVSAGIILVGIISGVVVAKNNPKVNLNQTAKTSSQAKPQNPSLSNTETEHKQKVCSDPLEEDQNSLVIRQYSEGEQEKVGCFSVGCGGLF